MFALCWSDGSGVYGEVEQEQARLQRWLPPWKSEMGFCTIAENFEDARAETVGERRPRCSDDLDGVVVHV